MPPPERPPYYILVGQANASTSSNRTLLHPTIHYSFSDDSPLTILPRSDQEHVLVLDYKPGQLVTAKSISGSVIATGVSVAPALDEGSLNEQMYTIETTTSSEWLVIHIPEKLSG